MLCKSYPSEFVSYFHYCRSLRFEDKPDYSYLKRLFRDLFIREGMSPKCWDYECCTFYWNLLVYLVVVNWSRHRLYIGYQFDYIFDWTMLKYPQISSSSRGRVSTFVFANFGYVFLLLITYCCCNSSMALARQLCKQVHMYKSQKKSQVHSLSAQ